MMDRVVLVIGLGFVEGFERNNLGDDRPFENSGFVELSYIGVGDVLLLSITVKDGRAILRACVWSLAIQFVRIVSDGKIYFEQLTIRNPRWIIFDLDRLSMSGMPFSYPFVMLGVC